MLLSSYTSDRQSEVASRSGLFIVTCVMYIFLKYIINLADFLETVANFEFSLSYSCSVA
jgi:hypothetical protein